MSEIYVTGHRNPDTDSIAAAMAYAHLQNALGNREYVHSFSLRMFQEQRFPTHFSLNT